LKNKLNSLSNLSALSILDQLPDIHPIKCDEFFKFIELVPE
jgi:hypothetical protein